MPTTYSGGVNTKYTRPVNTAYVCFLCHPWLRVALIRPAFYLEASR